MTIAFVLGNGLSRKDIDLFALQRLGKIYGCNALHREFTPDVLVSTDRPISTYIQESGYSVRNKFYTRRPIEGLGAHRVPQDYFGYSSGPIATAIAAQDQHRRIYLLGFDMGPTQNQTFNNLYAGTEFYKSADATPTYTGNWIKQICKVITDHPRTKFFRLCGPTTARISELESLKNLDHWELSAFLERINTQKDL
jgi:hypothetical protein